MSTKAPVPPAPSGSSAKTILDSLSNVGGYVGLAIQVGEVLIPVGKALVSKIKNAATGVTTIDYQLLVSEDQATLATVDSESTADLTAINAELVRQGASPLPLPPPAAPTS
jgi:hypothetical protein